jgi:hypothetical protein
MAEAPPLNGLPAPVGGPTSPGPNAFAGLVNVLAQMVQGQSASLKTLTAVAASLATSATALTRLTGNLAANYATGTWVPQLLLGGVATGITYGTQLGTYTILGREVICRFKIVLTSKGAATGAATISGLPATSNADGTNSGSGGLIAKYATMVGLSGPILLEVGPSSSAVSLFSAGATATAAVTDGSFANTSEIDGFLSFFT